MEKEVKNTDNILNEINFKNIIFESEDKDLVETVKTLFALSESTLVQHNAEAYKLVPYGSFFHELLESFEKYSDIPLEIPLFSAFHLISAHLMENDIKWEFDEVFYDCDIWTIVTADSGASKTKASDMVIKTTETKSKVSSLPTSTARLLEELAENGNRKLYIQDEFVKYLGNMKKQGYSAEMEEALLKIYSHSEISRRIKTSKTDEQDDKKTTIVVPNPCISILAFAPHSSFLKSLTIEDIESGFYPRFAIVPAKKDPNRKFEPGKMFLREKKMMSNLKVLWDEMLSGIKHQNYYFSEEMLSYFEETIYSITSKNEHISQSFVKRLFFLAFKYATIYHIILGKGKIREIDKQDIVYAATIFHYLLKNTANVLIESDKSDLQKLLEQARVVRQRMIDKKSKCIPSDLVQNIRGIKNANEAKAILSMIEEER